MSEEYGAATDMQGAYQEKAGFQLAAWKRESQLKKMGCVFKVLNGKHCLVIGTTGSGKTFWMAKVADTYFKRFIFVNPQLASSVSKICTTSYEEPEDLIEGVLDGDRAIEFIPSEDVETAINQLQAIRQDLFAIAVEIGAEEESWWMNFILDEAQNYAWKGSRNDVDNFGTRGRGFGIRAFFLTQRPQNLSSTLINEVQWQVIFQTGTYESVYFRTYKIPVDEHNEWLNQDYHYFLWNGREAFECEPIEE